MANVPCVEPISPMFSDDEDDGECFGLEDAEFQQLMYNLQDNDGVEEPDDTILSDHISDSDESLCDDDIDASINQYVYGKDRFKWSREGPSRSGRPRALNIVTQGRGLKGPVKDIGVLASPIQIWKRLFTKDMLDNILKWTNFKLAAARSKYTNTSLSFLEEIDDIELYAFIGLLFLSGVFKLSHEDLESMFSTDGCGRDIFRLTMSLKRFLIILSCLRFDNPNDRSDRIIQDPTAAVSDLFNQFISNCQNNYSLSAYVCIDETLASFRGRCKFKMYMPLKPAKYGIKFMMLTDATNGYLYNGYIYGGKNSDNLGVSAALSQYSKPTISVLRLSDCIKGTNRNITADNWFSSIELVEELEKNNLTYVGTIKKNKRQIPVLFQASKAREIGSTMYGFTKNLTLISYVPKKRRVVHLISSMHHSSGTDNVTGKPEIISFYNKTKGGVDSFDQRCANYTTSRRTRRWPMRVFFQILDASGFNSFILYGLFPNNRAIRRNHFLKQLAHSLLALHQNRRLNIPKMPREIKLGLSRILGVPVPITPTTRPPSKRRRCQHCPHNKTTKQCVCCQDFICGTCTLTLCQNCYK